MFIEKFDYKTFYKRARARNKQFNDELFKLRSQNKRLSSLLNFSRDEMRSNSKFYQEIINRERLIYESEIKELKERSEYKAHKEEYRKSIRDRIVIIPKKENFVD